MWNEDGSTNYDDADMGTWNDTTQENNSSWSSATGWKNGRRNLVKVMDSVRIIFHILITFPKISEV